MAKTINQRMTVDMKGDFVVFSYWYENKPTLEIHKWWPGHDGDA